MFPTKASQPERRMGPGLPNKLFVSVARTAAKPAPSSAIHVARPAGSAETTQAIARPFTRRLHQKCNGRHQTCHLHGKTPKRQDQPPPSQWPQQDLQTPPQDPMPRTQDLLASPQEPPALPRLLEPSRDPQLASSANIAWPAIRPTTSTVLCLPRQ